MITVPRVRSFAARVVKRYHVPGLLLKAGDVINVFEDDYLPGLYLFRGKKIPKSVFAKMRQKPDGLKPMEVENGNGNAQGNG